MSYRVGDDVGDDSVMRRGKGKPKFSGTSVTRRGEDALRSSGPEPGRRGTGTRHDADASGTGRPATTSTARDVTGVRPLDPIDPTMPNLR